MDILVWPLAGVIGATLIAYFCFVIESEVFVLNFAKRLKNIHLISIIVFGSMAGFIALFGSILFMIATTLIGLVEGFKFSEDVDPYGKPNALSKWLGEKTFKD